MGLRESLNKNAGLSAAVVGGAVLVLLGWILWQTFWSSPSATALGGGGQKYFTIDDGKSYFPDDGAKIPPFDKDGKPAVEAMVFKDLDKNEVFVGYLRRYTPSGKKMMEEIAKRGGGGGFTEGVIIENEVKRPGTGDAGWVKSTDPRATDVLNVTSPKGGINLEPHLPS